MTQNPDPDRPAPPYPPDPAPPPPAPPPEPHGDPLTRTATSGWGQQVPPPPPGPSFHPPYQQFAYAGYGNVAAPYGVHQPTGLPYSDKQKTVAGLLQLLLAFVGICGVGRLYAGHTGLGLAQLLSMFVGYILVFVLIGFFIVPAIWLWTVIDGIMILSSDAPKDGNGRVLRS